MIIVYGRHALLYLILQEDTKYDIFYSIVALHSRIYQEL